MVCRASALNKRSHEPHHEKLDIERYKVDRGETRYDGGPALDCAAPSCPSKENHESDPHNPVQYHMISGQLYWNYNKEGSLQRKRRRGRYAPIMAKTTVIWYGAPLMACQRLGKLAASLEGLFLGPWSGQSQFTMDFHHRTPSPVRPLIFVSVFALAFLVYYLWTGSGSSREPFVYKVRIMNDLVSLEFNPWDC